MKTLGKTAGRPRQGVVSALGKTGKTAGRPAPLLTCGFTGAREDREDRRAFQPRQRRVDTLIFPSSQGLMGEDGKTAATTTARPSW